MSVDLQERVSALVSSATFALDAGLPDLAARHAAAALRLAPDNPEARLTAARAAIHGAQPARAIASLDALDLYRPDLRETPAVAMLRARSLLSAGDYELAAALLDKLTRQFPDDVRPHRLLAATRLAQELPDRAAESLRHVLRLEPSDISARTTLAELIAPHDPSGTAELTLIGIKKTDEPAARLRVARALRRDGRLREAQEWYETLLTDRPQDAGLWLEAGELARDAGADAQAVEWLSRAVKLLQIDGRSIAAAGAALATAHMHAGRPAAAGRWWWKLTRRDGDDGWAWAGLLVCSLVEGRDRLVRQAQKQIEPHTSARERREMLARQWTQLSAGLVIRRVCRGDLTPAPACSPLHDLLRACNETLSRHAQTVPGRADTHFHLANLQEALGDTDGAVQEARKAVSINRRYTAARTLAAKLLRTRRRAG